MNTVHLSDAELAITRHGMTAFLRDFGHDEAEVVELIKQVLTKLGQAEAEQEPPVFVG